jgi:hypothetical protein
VNAFENGPEETDDAPRSGAPTLVMDECHMEQVKSVLERTCSILCMAIATEVRISPASVCHVLSSSLGKRTGCERWIPHMLNNTQRVLQIPATTHLWCWRNKGSAFLSYILTVDESWMHSFEPKLKRQNDEWRAQSSQRRNYTMQLGCSENYAHHVLQQKWTCS